VIALNFPSLKRFNPPLNVPIQTVPAESSWIETTKLLESPFRVVNAVVVDPRMRVTPRSCVPIHIAPSRLSEMALMDSSPREAMR
jgi:hypothetical protein